MRQNRKTGIPPITGTVVVGYNVTGSDVFYDPKNRIHIRKKFDSGYRWNNRHCVVDERNKYTRTSDSFWVHRQW